MKTVLVTGGGGFIGSEICEQLLKKKYKVRSFDLIKNNNKKINSQFTGTILDPVEISNAVSGCDYVIHLAASLGVANTEKNRLECLHINIQGTLNVLEACVKHKVKKLVFSSSSEVYGEQQESPISENSPLNPKSNYAISKIVCEEYLRAYFETYGLKYNICRFFNVYGKNQKTEFVMPIFIDKVITNKDIKIYGNGEQVRSFCNVKDSANGVIKVLEYNKNGQIFNIGNSNEPISLNNLAKKIIKISNKKIKIHNIDFKKSDRDIKREIFNRIPNINKAKKFLNYSPKISLDQGIRELLK